MTINELYEKALEIESKYTSDSNLSLYINKTRYQNGMIRYQLKHEGSGKIVDTGYGITNIRELLTVFEMLVILLTTPDNLSVSSCKPFIFFFHLFVS